MRKALLCRYFGLGKNKSSLAKKIIADALAPKTKDEPKGGESMGDVNDLNSFQRSKSSPSHITNSLTIGLRRKSKRNSLKLSIPSTLTTSALKSDSGYDISPNQSNNLAARNANPSFSQMDKSGDGKFAYASLILYHFHAS